jgi:hypothetical protein
MVRDRKLGEGDRLPHPRRARLAGEVRAERGLASFHRPHPDPYAKHYQVRDVREFLKTLGVRP